MFYNFFKKLIIIYVLLAYGSAVKCNSAKYEKAQRRVLGAVFVRKKLNPLTDILAENKILTVFEFYIVENLKELFKQPCYKKPVHYLEKESFYKKESIMTRSETERILQPKICRTNLKKLMEIVLWIV